MNLPTQAPAAIVIVNYGSHDLIERDFGSLDLASVNANIYVVDNFKSDADTRSINRICERHQWVLEINDCNEGFGAGVNRGVTRAQQEGCWAYLIVNPDVELTDSAMQALFAHLREEPNTVVSPLINRPDGRPWFAGGSLDMHTGAVRTSVPVDMSLPTSWLSGACLGITDQVWRNSGGFDENYFMYWEDLDFTARCRAAGADLAVDQDVVVTHDVGGTQGGVKSPMYTYYNCRNRLLYAAKWLSESQRKQWISSTGSRSYEILLRGAGRKALLHWTSVSAAARGTAAGLKIARRVPSPGGGRV